jgi:hypothetical protein
VVKPHCHLHRRRDELAAKLRAALADVANPEPT